MEEISKKVMDSIKMKKIAPESAAVSFLRKYTPWVAVCFVICFGGIATAVIFASFASSELDLALRLGGGFVFRSMPFFWIISFAFFLLLGKFTHGKTLFGYRNGLLKVALGYVLATVIIGGVFAYMNVPVSIQRMVRGNSFVHNMMFTQAEVWSDPKNGLLSGTIEGVDSNMIIIKDFKNRSWTIDIASSTVRGRVSLSVGEQIKILGVVREDMFVAEDIRPWISGMGSGAGRGVGRGMMR